MDLMNWADKDNKKFTGYIYNLLKEDLNCFEMYIKIFGATISDFRKFELDLHFVFSNEFYKENKKLINQCLSKIEEKIKEKLSIDSKSRRGYCQPNEVYDNKSISIYYSITQEQYDCLFTMSKIAAN